MDLFREQHSPLENNLIWIIFAYLFQFYFIIKFPEEEFLFSTFPIGNIISPFFSNFFLLPILLTSTYNTSLSLFYLPFLYSYFLTLFSFYYFFIFLSPKFIVQSPISIFTHYLVLEKHQLNSSWASSCWISK